MSAWYIMQTLPNDVLRYFCPALNAKVYLCMSTSSKRNIQTLREKRTRKGMRQLLRYVKYEENDYVVHHAPSGNRDGFQCAYTNTGYVWSRSYYRDGQLCGLAEGWSGNVLESFYSYHRSKLHGIAYSMDDNNNVNVALYRDNKPIARVCINNTDDKTIAKAYRALLAAEAIMKESD